ncbi:MAG: hypothetical protein J0I06_22630 [Planctomycetes bacterium]|nr:hypothetical protein [Planctomycetota bacterium]
MNAATNAEYRKLGLDSSNAMIEHDADRTLGRYPKAAWHILRAGLVRAQMGQMMSDDGNFTQAAADWLSAAACFDLATDPTRMREALDRVRKLDQEGKIPPERRDLHEAIKEREEELKALEQKLRRSHQDRQAVLGAARAANPEALAWLLTQVRELPGSPHLHADISDQAMALGQRALASESLAWARRFDPGSPHLALLQASQLFSLGEADTAAEIARAVLAEHPQMDDARFLLAQTQAFRAGADPNNWNATDWEAAINTLQPLVADGSPNTFTKLMAIGLVTTLLHGIGNEIEYRRALGVFDKLAESLLMPLARELTTRVRQTMPHVFARPGSNGSYVPAKPDYAAMRTLFSPSAVSA